MRLTVAAAPICLRQYYEGVRTRSSSDGERAPSPYNLGLVENLRQTFGADARLWLLPWVGNGHGGTSFPTRPVLRRQQTHARRASSALAGGGNARRADVV